MYNCTVVGPDELRERLIIRERINEGYLYFEHIFLYLHALYSPLTVKIPDLK